MIGAVIVDDEILSINNLSNMLIESDIVELKGRFTSAKEALFNIEKMDIDVIFLDIEMREMNGMDFASEVNKINENIKIIFVTAFNQYAVDAFEVSAVDYLMKPVRKERLYKTLRKISAKDKPSTNKKWDIKVNCFGKFVVEGRDGALVKWRTKKAEEFFAFLIDYRGKAVSRDRVMYILWEKFDASKAAVNLHTTVYNVKKALLSVGAKDILICSEGFYKVDESKINCDVWSLLDNINETEVENLSDESLDKMLNILCAGYFKENYFNWSEDKAKYFEGLFLKLVTTKLKLLKEKNQINKSIELLKKALIVDSLSENFNIELIDLLKKSGQEVEAKKHYNEYKRKVKKELGIKLEYKFKN